MFIIVESKEDKEVLMILEAKCIIMDHDYVETDYLIPSEKSLWKKILHNKEQKPKYFTNVFVIRDDALDINIAYFTKRVDAYSLLQTIRDAACRGDVQVLVQIPIKNFSKCTALCDDNAECLERK